MVKSAAGSTPLQPPTADLRVICYGLYPSDGQNRKKSNWFSFADYVGTTREASDPSLIHGELGIVDLDSSELNSCLKVLSMAKLALTEPIGSILRLAEPIERCDCSA